MSRKEVLALIRANLPDMQRRISPYRPWTKAQQQLALQACKMIVGVKE